MKKFYTTDEIREELKQYISTLQDPPQEHKDKVLYVDTFNNYLIRKYGVKENGDTNIPFDLNAGEESADFCSKTLFPICDFTGHEEYDLVVIGVTGSVENMSLADQSDHAKIIFGMNSGFDSNEPVSEEEFEKERKIKMGAAIKAITSHEERLELYIIVDFSFKVTFRISKMKPQ